MADLNLTEDRKQYQDLARDFAQKEIAKHAHKFDTSGAFPTDICRKAWEIGLANVAVPEELGGLGLGALDAVVIAEELAAGCAGISCAFLGNDLAVVPLLVAGTDEQKNRFVEPLMADFALAACSIAGSSKLLYSESNDKLVLHGEAVCLNVSTAPWILVQATAKENGSNTAFMVVPAKTAGVAVSPKLPAIGLQCADICTVTFDAVSLPKANMIIVDAAQSARVSATSDALIAAQAVGIARAALDNSRQYSKQRHTMGKPIGAHQAVGFMLADLAKDAEGARLLCRKAAWLIDAGEADASLAASAKVFACDGTMRGTTDAVQVYGGYGYSKEYPVEKLMRDAKSLQLYFGETMATKIEKGKQLVGSL